ncbi:hypothetical protein NKJ81_31130, partial [Mesorhizobium sp. M0018]
IEIDTASSSAPCFSVSMSRSSPQAAPDGVSLALTDGRLDRNFLLGHAGDAINALLVAAGQNLRLILTVLALWLAWCLQALQPKRAKSDAFTRLHGFGISTP